MYAQVGNQSIYHVSLTSADIEFSQTLPNRTKRFKIYAMTSALTSPHSDVLRVSLNLGKSNVASAHVPVPAGSWHEETDMCLTNQKVYFQSPTAGAKVVIISWA